MIRHILFSIALLLCTSSVQALEITRYVSIDGTGDGLTPENPTSDLLGMLSLGIKVDKLTIHLGPGYYKLDQSKNFSEFTFSNIKIDGYWNATDDNRATIDCPYITFINSFIIYINFVGNPTIKTGIISSSKISKMLKLDVSSGNCLSSWCEANNFYVWGQNHSYSASLYNCSSIAGNGFGLQVDDVESIDLISCKFNNKSGGGVSVERCRKANFFNCDISHNKGSGAIRLVEFDDSGIAMFNRCRFIMNTVTYNNSRTIYVYSNAYFLDCLFVGNKEKDRSHHGFLSLIRPDFLVLNCTFMDNHGGIELDSFYPGTNQIINCAFWNNGKDNIYFAGSEDVPLLNCAMDHATGIPELDAQKSIIMLTENNKGFKFTGTDIELEPSSVLVNNGIYRNLNDYDNASQPRNVFGATDIGCRELISVPGTWQPDSLILDTEHGDFRLFKANVNAKDYYCLVPKNYFQDPKDTGIRPDTKNIIYLDDMIVKPKVHDGKYIERHLKLQDEYSAQLLEFDLRYGSWSIAKEYGYKTQKDRPSVSIKNGNPTFVKPKPSAPKRSRRK